MAEIQPPMGVGEACSLLRSERRRRTLRVVADRTETTRGELARTLAADDSRNASTDEVELSLHHCHLPKLVEANAIRYDPDAGTAAITERGRRVVDYLDEFERA